MVFVIDSRRPDLGGNMRHGDIHTWSPVLWRYLVDRYAIKSVLDVGCGEGHAVQFFHRLGLYAHGIDGLSKNVERAVVPIALHDLLSGPYRMPVDFVWSCEVAEHILPEKADFYLDTLSNGGVVAMTHAVPGQDGHNHVNCQPAEYWIDKMVARGYRLSEDADIIKEVTVKEMTWTYFGRTGLIFVKAD